MHILHKDGRKFGVERSHGSYYVQIDGTHYTAATLEDLEKGLSSVGLTLKPEKKPDVVHIVDQCEMLLRSDISSLEHRQAAKKVLKQHAGEGNEKAKLLVQELESKQAVPASRVAQILTKGLGKNDFSDVTHEELTQHVPNLVLRSQLIIELGARTRLEPQ